MALSSRIYLDTNILLDVLERRPRFEKVAQVLQKYSIYSSSVVAIATSFYIAQKEIGLRVSDLKRLTSDFIILNNGAAELSKAYEICADEDLEDAIQVATAIIGGADTFLTADKKLLKNYGHLIDVVCIE